MDTDNFNRSLDQRQGVKPLDHLAFSHVGTVLRGLGRHHAKSFRAQAKGRLERVQTDPPALHQAVSVQASGLEDLLHIYSETLADPASCFVRGALRDTAEVAAAVAARRVRRNKAHVEAAARRFIVIDFDGGAELGEIDVVDGPDQAVASLLATLEHAPSAAQILKGTDVGWALSSSAGLRKADDGLYVLDRGVLKAHILIWLDDPVDDGDLQEWAVRVNTELGSKIIDPQALVFNQPIYGPPRLLGLDDWLPRRHGILRRGRPSAPTEALRRAAPPVQKKISVPRAVSPGAKASRPTLSAEGRRVYRAAWSGTVSKLREMSDGRGAALFSAAARWAALYDAVEMETLLGPLDALIDELRALFPDRSAQKTDRDLDRGKERGWRTPTEVPPRYLEVKADEPQLTADEKALALPEARRLHDYLTAEARLTPGASIHSLGTPGLGKSVVKLARARAFAAKGVVVIVAKDRKAALRDAEALRDLAPVAFIGRKTLTDQRDMMDWDPFVETDEHGLPVDAETCFFEAMGATMSCTDCSFKQRCRKGGYYGRRLDMVERLRKGGIIICTPQLWPVVLKEHDRLAGRGEAAVMPLTITDDVEPPQAASVSMDILWRAVEATEDDNRHAALLAVVHWLEEMLFEDPDDRPVVPGPVVRAAFKRLAIDADALWSAASALRVPTAVRTAVGWLLRGVDDLGFLVKEGGIIEVHPEPLALPSETALLVLDATADTGTWEALTGRTIERVVVEPGLPASLRVVHLEQATFEKARLKGHPEDFKSRLGPVVKRIQADLRWLALDLDKPVEELQVLFVAHKALIDSHLWPLVSEALLDDLPLAQTIHWRGVDQKGSNDFEGFDAVITLGTPLMNIGAWRRRCQAIGTARALRGLPVDGETSGDEEAEGVVTQAIFRARLLQATTPQLVVVVGAILPKSLEAAATTTRAVKRPGPTPSRVSAWLKAEGLEVISTALADLDGAPSRKTLARAFEASTWQEFTVHIKGRRGRPSKWKSPSMGHVASAAFRLLRGRGGGALPSLLIKPVEPVGDGVPNFGDSSGIKQSLLEPELSPLIEEADEPSRSTPPPPRGEVKTSGMTTASDNARPAPSASKRPHVSHNSGEVEWYTPPHIIEAARTAMGGIDVDPASCALANETVRAETFFTADDDGLAHPWRGRVWLNPPYARGVIDIFIAGLIVRLDAGEVEQACVLVNAATETKWAQLLLSRSKAVCFPKGRLRFWSPDGPKGTPLQGQMVAYLGDHPEAFEEAFRGVGAVWMGRGRGRPRSAGLRG